MKDKNLKKSLIKTVSFILSGFVVVVAATIGIMYLAGSFNPIVVTPTSIYFEKDLDFLAFIWYIVIIIWIVQKIY